MGDRGGVPYRGAGSDTARLRVVRELTAPVGMDRVDSRDSFRVAVGALGPGPLRELLTAVAYARDEAARTGSATVSTGRWTAVVAAAERAVGAEVVDVSERPVAVA
jgi:hypothetical protein